jgi:thiol:disulfide interchange protein DsbD
MRLWGVALVALVGSGAFAQAAKDPVTWSFPDPLTRPVRAGDAVTVRLAASIQAGWHLYALDVPEHGPMPTEISLPADSMFTLGVIRAPKVAESFDPAFRMRVGSYSNSAEFQLPLKVRADAAPGAARLAVGVRFQTCNGQICLRPKAVTLEMPVTIGRR